MTANALYANSATQRLLRLFRFSPSTRRALWIGGTITVLLVLVVLCVLAFGGPPGETLRDGFVTIGGGTLMFLTPLGLFFLLLAVLLEKRSPPRALLWGVLALLTALDGLLLAALSAWDMGDAGPGLVFLLVVFGPLFLLLTLPAVYYGAKTLPEVRAVLHDSHTARVLALIKAHGKISIPELAKDAGLPESELGPLVDELLGAGRLAGMLNPRHRLIFTSTYLDAQQRLMLDLVRAGGRLRLAQLAASLAIPADVLNDWLYQVIQRGQFSGSLNWNEGWIYSRTAQKIGRDSQCLNCGGRLIPAGGETIHCEQCGSEAVN